MNDRAYLHESEYRGADAIEKLATVNITLCGAGAIGSLLADNLVRQGFRKMRVIDCDRVEEHNVGTQLYDRSDVGGWKSELLRNRLFRACEAEIDAVTKRLESTNVKKFLKASDVVIDALDNSQSRQLVQDHCRASGLECLHVGLYQDYCEAIWDADYRVPSDVGGDVCEYPLARNLVLLSVSIASELLLGFILDGEKRNLSATLKDFSVRELET